MGGQSSERNSLAIKVQAMEKGGAHITPEEQQTTVERGSGRYEQDSTPLFATARLWVDGVVDPLENAFDHFPRHRRCSGQQSDQSHNSPRRYTGMIMHSAALCGFSLSNPLFDLLPFAPRTDSDFIANSAPLSVQNRSTLSAIVIIDGRFILISYQYFLLRVLQR